jgi:hypothetical protein
LESTDQAPGATFKDLQLLNDPEFTKLMPPGSYRYQGQWNPLDRFALVQQGSTRIRPAPNGFRIHIPSDPTAAETDISERYPYPRRYRFRWEKDSQGNPVLVRTGRSDHFPITMTFTLGNP